jgi:hypothetical protein
MLILTLIRFDHPNSQLTTALLMHAKKKEFNFMKNQLDSIFAQEKSYYICMQCEGF